jgi:hypothetical protein
MEVLGFRLTVILEILETVAVEAMEAWEEMVAMVRQASAFPCMKTRVEWP